MYVITGGIVITLQMYIMIVASKIQNYG